MKHRSPLAVFFLSLFTLGIYAIVWHVKTKGELNRLGAHIPTSWLLIVPFANLYWLWKYSEGVDQVTGGKISAVTALILLLVLSIVGYAILQSLYNKLGNIPVAAAPGNMTPQPNGVPVQPPNVPADLTQPQAPVVATPAVIQAQSEQQQTVTPTAPSPNPQDPSSPTQPPVSPPAV